MAVPPGLSESAAIRHGPRFCPGGRRVTPGPSPGCEIGHGGITASSQVPYGGACGGPIGPAGEACAVSRAVALSVFR